MTFQQEQRPRRRDTFIVAAVFVVVIVIAGVVVGIYLGARGNHNTADPTSSPSTTPSTSTPTSRTTAGACGQVPYATTDNLTAAPATKWVSWSATTLATSSTAGPSKDTDGVRTCYSRTPAGALFAAYNSAQYCADATVLPTAMAAITADGPGKAIVLRQAASSGACEPSGQYVQGYRIVSYDGTTATLYLELNPPSGLAEYGVQMTWQSGDWKVATDSQGNSPIASNQLSSSAGFVPWGPTNG